MRSYSKCFFIGHTTRNPEVRQTTGGAKVATISIATNRTWKDSSGAIQEATDYHDLVFWGGLADVVERNVGVGQAIFVVAEPRTRKWEAPDGSKRYKTEFVVQELNILTWGDKEKGSGSDASMTHTMGSEAPASSPAMPADDINIEDIPF